MSARLVLLASALGLSGCAFGPVVSSVAPPSYLNASGDLGDCARLFAALDRRIEDAGVSDVQDARIPGFPYLRVNRFLAADVKPPVDGDTFAAWFGHLEKLDQVWRHIELRNAPLELPLTESPGLESKTALQSYTDDCRPVFRRADLEDPDRRRQLHMAASVADSYHLGQRLFGAYAFTGWALLAGIDSWHEEMRTTFATDLSALPVVGRLHRYGPVGRDMPTAAAIENMLSRSRDNPLHIPLPNDSERDALFSNFAPVFEVDVLSDDDRLGTPTGGGLPTPRVDTSRPVVYRHMSHVRFDGETLLQLNYVVWFPARPLSGPFDILGGVLDGITWRVTLDRRGRPILYDAMHNCGCFHQFFLTGALRPKPPSVAFEEPIFVAQTIPSGTDRLVLRIANTTHYIERVHAEMLPAERTDYEFADYVALRSLPAGAAQHRSFFAANGIVLGSERRERWLFWPMGVANAGAMRQWGQHATAFVGRRHFDDVNLIERYFRRQ